VLATKCHVTVECWTSDLRTHFGFPLFADFEGDYADFTVTNPYMVRGITGWLVGAGYTELLGLAVDGVTYHLEVKATAGSSDEPFSISNSQYNQVCCEHSDDCHDNTLMPSQAKRCHESRHDIYVVLRVFDLNDTPKLIAYVDPIELQNAGKLRFIAQHGYDVTAN
jgi:hypothetical protein